LKDQRGGLRLSRAEGPAAEDTNTPMPSQRAIETFALLNFLIVGLSLISQPGAWAKYFAWMRRNGEGGAVIYGLFCVLWGSLIVSFHREWNGLLVILPIFGSIQLLEGLVFLVAPDFGLRIMGAFNENNLGLFRLLGVIALVLAAIIVVAIQPLGF
jgi:uncharacterized protein YjeT (DUF2065 family)